MIIAEIRQNSYSVCRVIVLVRQHFADHDPIQTATPQTRPEPTLLGNARQSISTATGMCFTRGMASGRSNYRTSYVCPFFRTFLNYPTESVVAMFALLTWLFVTPEKPADGRGTDLFPLRGPYLISTGSGGPHRDPPSCVPAMPAAG
jgi:hypothetical protein